MYIYIYTCSVCRAYLCPLVSSAGTLGDFAQRKRKRRPTPGASNGLPSWALYIYITHYSSFYMIFQKPNITPIYYSSFHFLFQYPHISPSKGRFVARIVTGLGYFLVGYTSSICGFCGSSHIKFLDTSIVLRQLTVNCSSSQL